MYAFFLTRIHYDFCFLCFIAFYSHVWRFLQQAFSLPIHIWLKQNSVIEKQNALFKAIKQEALNDGI